MKDLPFLARDHDSHRALLRDDGQRAHSGWGSGHTPRMSRCDLPVQLSSPASACRKQQSVQRTDPLPKRPRCSAACSSMVSEPSPILGQHQKHCSPVNDPHVLCAGEEDVVRGGSRGVEGRSGCAHDNRHGRLQSAVEQALADTCQSRMEDQKHALHSIEASLTRNLTSHAPQAQRTRGVHAALTDLSTALPRVAPIVRYVARHLQELNRTVAEMEDRGARALAEQEAMLNVKCEAFVEEKISNLLREQTRLQQVVQRAQAEIVALRQARDVELSRVKSELMQRLSDYERREQDVDYYRQLIATVYKTNEQLTGRQSELESLLTKHRIQIPPACSEESVREALCGGRVHSTMHSSPSRTVAVTHERATFGKPTPDYPALCRLGAAQDGGNIPPASVDGRVVARKSSAHARRVLCHVSSHTGQCGTKDDTAEENTVMHISQQVPVAFIAASKAEMNVARLALQGELLNNAFDERSSYRMQIKCLKQDKTSLTFELHRLQERTEKLSRYIYEKRFLTSSSGTSNNSTNTDANDAIGVQAIARPLTPRPCDLPFAIQTDLGIGMERPTAEITAELAAVAINLKHQLNAALLRLRQANHVADWMDRETLMELETTNAEVSSIPIYAHDMWPSIPHFLRTRLDPTTTTGVANLCWSANVTAAIVHTLFCRYAELRRRCRGRRDDKMLHPRVALLSERCKVSLTRLDATPAEMSYSEENVPFGYVVSQFIHDFLVDITAEETREMHLVLPATLYARYVVPGGGEEEAVRVVELERTRMGYNLWYAVQRHQHSQPLCRFFVQVADGCVPVGVFACMQQSLQRLHRCVHRLDTDGSHLIPYARLLHGVMGVVSDMPAQTVHGAVLAVRQTFEANATKVLGGRIRCAAIVADESCCLRERMPGDGVGGSVGRHSSRALRDWPTRAGDSFCVGGDEADGARVYPGYGSVDPANSPATDRERAGLGNHWIEDDATGARAAGSERALVSSPRRNARACATPNQSADGGGAAAQGDGDTEKEVLGDADSPRRQPSAHHQSFRPTTVGQLESHRDRCPTKGSTALARVTIERVMAHVNQPLGASVLTRYWRRVILRQCERVYDYVEYVLAPLVRESDLVVGIYLLPVQQARSNLRRHETMPDARMLDSLKECQALSLRSARDVSLQAKAPECIDEAAEVPMDRAPEQEPASASHIGTYGKHKSSSDDNEDGNGDGGHMLMSQLGMPTLSGNFLTLLRERNDAVHRERAAERVELERLFDCALVGLPRLNYAVHFPFDEANVGKMGAANLPTAQGVRESDEREGTVEGTTHILRQQSKNILRDDNRAKNASTAANSSTARSSRVAVKKPNKDTKRGDDVVQVKASAADRAKSRAKTSRTSRPEKAVQQDVSKPATFTPPNAAPRPDDNPSSFHALPDDTVALKYFSSKGEQMVEWYQFCAQLRQHIPSFPQRIFAPLSAAASPTARQSTPPATDDNASGQPA